MIRGAEARPHVTGLPDSESAMPRRSGPACLGRKCKEINQLFDRSPIPFVDPRYSFKKFQIAEHGRVSVPADHDGRSPTLQRSHPNYQHIVDGFGLIDGFADMARNAPGVYGFPRG